MSNNFKDDAHFKIFFMKKKTKKNHKTYIRDFTMFITPEEVPSALVGL